MKRPSEDKPRPRLPLSQRSTHSSLDEAMRPSLFNTDPFLVSVLQRRETRASIASGRTQKIPRLLWRCSLSARTFLSRNRPDDQRKSYGSRLSCTTRSSSGLTESHLCPTCRLETSTQLGGENLQFFREEAEYSDYLSAHVTGEHWERRADGVVFYEIEAHLSKQRWTVVRRFSEFRTLRQQLFKHFGRAKRSREPHCAICENVLASIVETTFPSRQVWGSTLFSSSSTSASKEETIEERKTRFQAFVSMCVLTIRSLRQHMRVLPQNLSCEISVALRLIEEFVGLSFTRYLGFLGERGIVDQGAETRLSLRQRPEQ